MLTKEEQEIIIKVISSGRDSYADLHRALPNIPDSIWIQYIGDNFFNVIKLPSQIPILLFFKEIPEDYSPHYVFKGEERFKLSVTGENILYELKKQRKNEILLLVSSVASVLSVLIALLK